MSYKITSYPMLFIAFAGMLGLSGCNQQPMTDQQLWAQFCKVYESASFTIMADRQEGVEFEKALEHAKKLPEGQKQQMFIDLVKAAHAQPQHIQRKDRQEAIDHFMADKYELCLETPHEKQVVH